MKYKIVVTSDGAGIHLEEKIEGEFVDRVTINLNDYRYPISYFSDITIDMKKLNVIIDGRYGSIKEDERFISYREVTKAYGYDHVPYDENIVLRLELIK